MKFRNLVKSVEFLFVVGFAALGFFFDFLALIPAVVLAGGYVALNLTGWAAKTVNPDPDKPSKTVNPDPDKP